MLHREKSGNSKGFLDLQIILEAPVEIFEPRNPLQKKPPKGGFFNEVARPRGPRNELAEFWGMGCGG